MNTSCSKDVEAVAVSKSSVEADQHLRRLLEVTRQYTIPVVSMESNPVVRKGPEWYHFIRHLQQDVYKQKTTFGDTFGQI